jgi:hypothetical protein
LGDIRRGRVEQLVRVVEKIEGYVIVEPGMKRSD